MEWYYVVTTVVIPYIVGSLWGMGISEQKNRYPTNRQDFLYGMFWPFLLVKWVYRLPARIKTGPSEGIVRILRDVWNG